MLIATRFDVTSTKSFYCFHISRVLDIFISQQAPFLRLEAQKRAAKNEKGRKKIRPSNILRASPIPRVEKENEKFRNG